MHQRRVPDLLGAHVSTQGGVHHALARGRAIGATAIQVFTKTPNQWREPALSEEVRTAFRRECEQSEIARIVAHDSYLINLATPDPVLAARSVESFTQGDSFSFVAMGVTFCPVIEVPEAPRRRRRTRRSGSR